jgi:hypothetical protein
MESGGVLFTQVNGVVNPLLGVLTDPLEFSNRCPFATHLGETAGNDPIDLVLNLSVRDLQVFLKTVLKGNTGTHKGPKTPHSVGTNQSVEHECRIDSSNKRTPCEV